jgi:EAL domain-containing protein (putative c-di-GMP-specific phosphodiesterase class I)
MRLIVLDDSAAITEFMAAVARIRGWEPRTATQAEEFREMVRASPPDAIMLDLQLGKSDGVEQLRFLHKLDYIGPIILMSGFDARVLASARQIGDSLGLKVVAVVEKPARAARIHEVLAAIERQPRPTAPTAVRQAMKVDARAITVRDIATAINAGHMELHLQPIIAAIGRGVTRAEALIRWRDPTRGLVAPDQFVPVAESDEVVIDHLTMWVAEAATLLYRQLAERGSMVQICINVSGQNLRSLDFPDRMIGLCERMAVPPDALGLEITESVAMHDLDATAAVLTRLRLNGFPVAIDDFGIGHSSLAMLRRMPFSTVKIDKSFVSDMHTSSDSLTIVRSIIQLAHDMHLTTVAEGIESSSAAGLLTELGIDGLQGYYFSKPLPFDEFTEWLRVWSRRHDAVPIEMVVGSGSGP